MVTGSTEALMPGVDIIQDLTGKYALQNCIGILKVGAVLILLGIIISSTVCVLSEGKKKYAIIILPVLMAIISISVFTIQYSAHSQSKIYRVMVSKEADKKDFAELCIVLEDNGSMKIVQVVQED